MCRLNKFLPLLLLALLVNCKIKSQTLIGTAGNSVNTNQLNFSYSIGESITGVYNIENFIIIEGLYQDFSFKINEIPFQLKENPVKGYIKYSSTLKDAKFKLIALTGQVIKIGDLNGEPIDVTALKPSIYIISIYNSNKAICSLKIIVTTY
jgi:hypothetical protein